MAFLRKVNILNVYNNLYESKKTMRYAMVMVIGLNVSVMVSSFAMQQSSFSLDITLPVEQWDCIEPYFTFPDIFPQQHDQVLPKMSNQISPKINNAKLIQVVKKRCTVSVAQKPEKPIIAKQQKPFSSTFLDKLNAHIRSQEFAETYGLIENNFNVIKNYPLADKLMAIVFKKINSVEEFCNDLTAFPQHTGVMAESFAYFGRNQKFIEDYENYCLVRTKNKLSPIILSLIKNHSYCLRID